MVDNMPVVIDNGSGMTKVGFSGDDAPRSVFPTLVGTDGQEDAVGHEARAKSSSVTTFAYPVERGLVVDWNAMEKIWHHTFYNELRVDPKAQAVVLTEPIVKTKAHRERMVQIMFDTFNVPSMFAATRAFLALYATGRVTGSVVDSGYHGTEIVPIYEGYPMPQGAKVCDIAGRDLTNYLTKMLKERGYSFNTDRERNIVRDIKERLCYVAYDFKEETKNAAESPSNFERKYEMPDGKFLVVGKERFHCPELFFGPMLNGLEIPDLATCVNDSMDMISLEQRPELYANIVLAGGSTLFEGFKERLAKEVTAWAPARVRVKVTAPAERKHLAWTGGSAVATLPSLESMFVTNEEYKQNGAKCVHQKWIF